MTVHQKAVRDFCVKFQHPVHSEPSIPDRPYVVLCYTLIAEDLNEFATARSLVEVGKALGKLLYTVNLAGNAFGIDLDLLFNEIHRSNMTELWRQEELNAMPDDCRSINVEASPREPLRCYLVKDEAGKVMKSPSYSPADIQTILIQQFNSCHSVS